MQSALIRIYVAWPRIGQIGVSLYARKAVITAVYDDARRPWRRERPVDRTPDRAADPAGDPERVDDRLALLGALATVPPRQRAVLVLRYYEDLSVEQTAGLLGVSTGTVKSQAARGLAALRRNLGAVGIELADDRETPVEESWPTFVS